MILQNIFTSSFKPSPLERVWERWLLQLKYYRYVVEHLYRFTLLTAGLKSRHYSNHPKRFLIQSRTCAAYYVGIRNRAIFHYRKAHNYFSLNIIIALHLRIL